MWGIKFNCCRAEILKWYLFFFYSATVHIQRSIVKNKNDFSISMQYRLWNWYENQKSFRRFNLTNGHFQMTFLLECRMLSHTDRNLYLTPTRVSTVHLQYFDSEIICKLLWFSMSPSKTYKSGQLREECILKCMDLFIETMKHWVAVRCVMCRHNIIRIEK